MAGLAAGPVSGAHSRARAKDPQIHTSTLSPKVGPEQRLRMTPKCDLLECTETALGSGGKHE